MKNAPPEEDDHYFIHGGRRWRKTDPHIPESLRSELVKALMSARRAVKDAKASGSEPDLSSARSRVHQAKLALGERGRAWWLPIDVDSLTQRLEASITTLLSKRGADSTICPSDAARVSAGPHWRDWMEAARETAWAMAERGEISVTQSGESVQRGVHGPLRLKLPLRATTRE